MNTAKPCDFAHVLGYGRPVLRLVARTDCDPTLLRLVEETERAERALDAYTDREENDDEFVELPGEWKALTGTAGQARAALALHPATTMAEIALKARALVANTDSDYEAAHLRDDLTNQGGHAYTIDLLRGLAIDLLRMAEGTLCA